MGRLHLGLCLATWGDRHGRANSRSETRELALLAEAGLSPAVNTALASPDPPPVAIDYRR